MPLDARLLQLSGAVLLVSCQPYPAEFCEALPAHVQCVQLPGIDGRVDLAALLQYLGKSCNSVLVEAGATLCGAFVSCGLADQLILYQAPKILGAAGRNLLQLPPYQQLSEIPALQLIEQRKVGVDNRLTLKIGY
jgi:diaminohydroxyphosphoribosylaminopyrimidine deaminase/5-amino-6-(5-phosphoribosylamino)uracil reductase